ncbi:imm11 family protein [Hyphomicrobium sulfonivorans]|uniref:imm11 family protein n=1 Tax=Hyphomicrobium sulfonivorans TaxID=121290 RepID=UPI00156E85D6|nr:DUF1629 domain-containing protein [Hyphomicrobium sulfonivorans]MBI1651403.1 hypothetical protein [Hyphomicrobium sulfonivorans]NSL72430.1 hypothetical protein [Hyphomicrobium sulfonivorans]
MTWLIDLGLFPVIGTVDKYVGIGSPEIIGRNTPIPQSAADELAKGFKFHARAEGLEHIILDQSKYLILSAEALEALRPLQSDGWQAIPVRAVGSDAKSKKAIAGNPYYLLDVYLQINAFDVAKGNVPPKTINKGSIVERIVYRLDDKHRSIAVRTDLVGGLAIWRGDIEAFVTTIFVSDELKRRWCDLGVTEALFEPCIDV